MSKVCLVVTDAQDPARTVGVLRRVIVDASVRDLRRKIGSGAPVFECQLFENDHVEVDGRLRALVRELPESGARVRIFELRPGEDLDLAAARETEIGIDTLLAILDDAKGRFA